MTKRPDPIGLAPIGCASCARVARFLPVLASPIRPSLSIWPLWSRAMATKAKARRRSHRGTYVVRAAPAPGEAVQPYPLCACTSHVALDASCSCAANPTSFPHNPQAMISRSHTNHLRLLRDKPTGGVAFAAARARSRRRRERKCRKSFAPSQAHPF